MSTRAGELVSHRDVVANGIRLHCVVAGPEAGDLVVLLHGFPEYWYSWRHQIPALVDAGYRVVAPDMRGYNRSEKPHGVAAYRLPALVGDVVGLLDAFGADQAHVVGHDWGGVVAWELAGAHPERVTSLTVMNAPHPAKYVRECSLEQARRSWYVLAFQIPWLPERLFASRDFAAFETLFGEGAVEPNAFTPAEIERYKAAFRRPGALESAINYYRALFRDSMPGELLARVPVVGPAITDPVTPIEPPTLVVWGERDVALSIEQVEGLERYVETVRIERVPDASHWVQVDRPDRVTDALVGFLESNR
ncbi:alpha/beta fold hydrolase [Natronobeatus ordinarius]|uniref:alpha/beta fold hydrolase n=1 Tax=Natronobeatus ordinarius TaxID=2963433 RepID=UPI0026EE5E5A|nr:alpha/beta hydrolase [Natronobeatus ordinarius]